ncbi:hypothetical protein [Caenimonas koreensis]|uniref:Uncharacterized protein n=1 Tax=Caenimonas koreensis DSM 17982 TaxID=1121255 RepID=A0A844B7N3_9BURK|nr:hypothetical protein [Caenimonas koreensis]MRD47517.1 hypothetical protein [Caenimonas koreensis DSM 17982]
MNDKTQGGRLPDEVRRYVIANVPSVPYLEAALLLRAEPTQEWDAAKLAQRLYIKPREAADLLHTLQNSLVAMPVAERTACRYTADPVLAKMLDAVAQAYASNLFEVTDLIHTKLDKRARVFADAFKLRKS